MSGPQPAAKAPHAANGRFGGSWQRWLRRVAAILVGAELFYVVAANTGLRVGVVQLAFAETDSIKVDFASAWTVWPGRVHAREVVVHMQDRNVQFVLRVAHADVTIAISALFRNTFHATRVRAEGVSFRFRHRIQPQSSTKPFVATLPPLEGYPDPPIVEAGPPPPPLTEANYNLWTIHLENVDADVNELWAQTVRFQGTAHARGAFRLRPAKRVWVNPASLTLETGTLTTGPHTFLSDVHGEIRCTVDPFDVEPVVGMGMFAFISARVDVHGRVPGLSVLPFWFGDLEPWSIGNGAGSLDVRANMNHGVIVDDSDARWQSADVRVEHRPTGWSVSAAVDLQVVAPAPAHPARLSLALPRAEAFGAEAAPIAIELGGAEGWARTNSVDLTLPWELTGAGASLSDLRVSNLAALDPLLPKMAAAHLGGEARISARAERDAVGSWGGSFDGALKQAVVEANRARLAATGQLSGTFQSNTDKLTRASLELTLPSIAAALQEMNVTTALAASAQYASDRASASSWRADLHLNKLRAFEGRSSQPRNEHCPWLELDAAHLGGALDLDRDAPPDARMTASLQKPRLVWGQFAAGAASSELAAHLHGRTANVDGHLEVRALELKNEGGAPRSWQASAPSFRVDAELRDTQSLLNGPVRFQVSGLDAQVGTTKLAGEVGGRIGVSGRAAAASFALTGDVAARRVAVSTGAQHVQDWWANLRVSQAELKVHDQLELRAAVQASLQNALPVLNLLTEQKDLPAWMPAALPLEKLSVALEIERHCRLTDLRVREAKGGPLSARGRFQLQPGETRGAVLVTLPALIPASVGFDFVEDQTNTSALVGDDWFERHDRLMDKELSETRSRSCAPAPPACP